MTSGWKVIPGAVAAIFAGLAAWQCLIAARKDHPKERIYAALYVSLATFMILGTLT